MIARLSAGALALALAATIAPRPAAAQDDAPIVFNIAGPCVIALDGRPQACTGVAYMAFPSNHRIDFTAITEQAGWAFSGQDDAKADGRYSLAVDSVLNPRAGRIDAEGECDMQVAEDGRTVSGIVCEAKTAAGDLTLKASGVLASSDDQDDGDDDDDSGAG